MTPSGVQHRDARLDDEMAPVALSAFYGPVLEALDSFPMILALLDGESRFLRVNGAATVFLGRSEQQLVGRDVRDFLTPASRSQAEAVIASGAMDTGVYAAYEWSFDRPDGTVVWGAVRTMRLKNDAGETFARVSVVEDITEARASSLRRSVLEEALRSYQRMFERGSLGQLTVDIDSFRIKAVNPALCSMTGYAADELVEHDVAMIFPDGGNPSLETVERLADGVTDGYTAERQILHRSGRVLPVTSTVSAIRDDDGVARQVMVLIQELTEQRAAEEEQRRSQAMVDAAIAGLPVTFVTFDAGLHFLTVRGGGVRRRGNVAEMFIGRHITEVTTDPVTLAALELALLGGETTNRTRVNDETYSTLYAPLTAADGTISGVVSVSVDITAEVLAEEESSHSRALVEAVLHTVPLLIASFDNDGRLVDGAGDLIEANLDQLRGRRLDEGRQSEAAGHVDRALAGTATSTTLEFGSRHYETFYTPRLGPDATIDGALAVGLDVTERHEAEQLALFAARHDPLTGLPGRSALVEGLNARFAAQAPAGTLLMLDLDDFNLVNHSLGYDVGDAVLLEVASRLSTLFPDHMVARHAGNEFAVHAPFVVANDEALGAADDVRRSLDEEIVVGPHVVRVSVSVGIAVEGKATSSATMIRNAESALYNAKQDRTGQVRVWDAEMLRQAQHRLSRQNGLRTALAAGELHIAYQPIVRLADRVIIGAEALLRWTHPDDGPIAPFDFIPIAERSGLIVPIGRWVMTQACGDIVGLNRVHGLRIAVNVAARQLLAGDFAQWVQEVIDGTGLPASALTVEVTEGALMEDLAPVRTAFACLRERGIKVAIDDFGTGYSSLARLQDLPVDVVKLDRAFVTDIVERPEARRMAAAILQLSTAINADIIAEGVETEEEAAVLEDLGYNSAQGYLFARPMPLAELTGLLESAAAR